MNFYIHEVSPHCDNEYCIMKDGKGVGFKHSNYSLCEYCTLILNN